LFFPLSLSNSAKRKGGLQHTLISFFCSITIQRPTHRVKI
jgi:hypothetical protein